MTIPCEALFDPQTREWLVGCPKCTERAPVGFEGMTGRLYTTCLADGTAMYADIQIASMPRR